MASCFEDQLLAKVDKEQRKEFTSFGGKRLIAQEQSLGHLFNFIVDDRGRSYLNNKGIYVSPLASFHHSHPINKMLENHILYNLLPSLIDKSFCLVSIKPSKVAILESIMSINSLNVINRIIDSKDYFRYGLPSTSSNKITYRSSHGVENFDAFTSLQGFQGNYFFHDELHHWNKEKLCHFLNSTRPNIILASVIYPVEILGGFSVSCNPTVYSFEILKDGTFNYYPDGCTSEAYNQQIANGYLLKTNQITLLNGDKYNVKVLNSFGAHHLICISKGSFPVETTRNFSDFECCDFKEWASEFRLNVLEGIRAQVLKQVLFYLFSLKKVDPKAGIAKLRQLDNEGLNFSELFLVNHITDFLSHCSNKPLSDYDSILEKALAPALPEFVNRIIFKNVREKKVQNLIRNIRPLEIKIDCLEMVEGLELSGRLIGLSKDLIDSFNTSVADSEFLNCFLSGGESSFDKTSITYLMSARSPCEYFLRSDEIFEADSFSTGRVAGAISLRAVRGAKYTVLESTLERNFICLPSFEENRKKNGGLNERFEELSSSNFVRDLRTAINLKSGNVSEVDVQKVLKCPARMEKMDHIQIQLLTLTSDDVVSFGKLKFRNTNFQCLHSMGYKGGFIVECLYNNYEFGSDSFPLSIIIGNVSVICLSGHLCLNIKDGIYGEEIALSMSRGSKCSFFIHQDYRVSNSFFSLVDGTRFLILFNDFLNLDLDEKFNTSGLKDGRTFEVNDCFINSCSEILGVDYHTLMNHMEGEDREAYLRCLTNQKVFISSLSPVIRKLNKRVWIEDGDDKYLFGSPLDEIHPIKMVVNDSHLSLKDATPEELSVTEPAKREEHLNEVGNLNLYCKSATKINFQIDEKNASKVAIKLHQGTLGIMPAIYKRKNFTNLMDYLFKQTTINMEIRVVFGFAGCGKSHGVLKFLTERELSALIVCPRKFLCDDWTRKLGSSSSKAITFEPFFTTFLSDFDYFILDEVDLFPRGMIDLILFQINRCKKGKKNIIALGDPLQAKYHGEEESEDLNSIPCFSDRVRGARYLFESRRSDGWAHTAFKVPCLRSDGMRPEGLRNTAILCPSREFRDQISMLGNSDFEDLNPGAKRDKCTIATYTEVQGMTFDRITICLSRQSLLASEENILSALTRSVEKPLVHIASDLEGVSLEEIGDNRVLRYLLKGEPIDARDLCQKWNLKIVNSSLVGNSYFDKAQFDYALMAFADILKEELVEEPTAEDEIVIEAICSLKTIPSPSFFSNSEHLASLIAKERREKSVVVGSGLRRREISSDQFAESVKHISCIMSDVDNFTSIFPRHSNSDRATFKMAVKKRLRFRSFLENHERLEKYMPFGENLANFFISRLNLKGNVNDFMEISMNEFKENFFKKDEATMVRNSARSDPDWKKNEIFLFMKQQLCKKIEKRYSEAIAGQTISCFQHEVLWRFSALCRSTEKVLSANLPKNWYVHNRKDFDSLNTFVKSAPTFREGLENDYSAFDASQDHKILAFELTLLRHIGWTENDLSDYKNLKLNLKCGLGGLSVMRFTGEFCTFLFNTITNILLVLLKYENPEDSYILFAGDDMACLGPLVETQDNEEILEKITLKSKTLRLKYPRFCGWVLTPKGIFKQNRLLLERFVIAIENDKLHDCIESLFMDYRFNLSLGDEIYCFLNEEEISYFSEVWELFKRFLPLLKGEVLKTFRSFERLVEG